LFLTEKTRRLLEETIGKSVSELSNMSYDEEIAFVTEKTEKLQFIPQK
jgi:hypothetical protein